jgi:diguanylate cyclase (GGDEF)-like protein/PAS domain S-box-containing protein
MSISAPTILIVDDDARNRRLLAVLLHPKGYQTESAASGEEALTAVAHSPPDLILLDLMMPGIDGYEVAGILKANPATANIPIIMVTGEGEPGMRLASLAAGAEEFLSKPIDSTELQLRVRNLLRLKELGDLQEHSFVLQQQVAARTADLQRFRAAMDATADAIMLISRDTMRFVEVNATSCKMLGYSRAEMLDLGPVALGAISRPELDQLFDTLILGDASPKLSEVQLTCKDGSLVHVEINRKALLSGTDWIIVSVVRDITERKQAEKSLQHQANHDALTGLPNRAFFYEKLRRTIALAARHDWKVAVMFIDIDHFKNVNDTLGHGVGDDLLKQFSTRLTSCVRARDTVGRLGGDEFGLMLIMEHGHHGAGQVAVKIGEALQLPFNLHGYEVIVTASMGITIHPDDAGDTDALIKYADTAMYQAKHAGRNTYRFFTAQMNIDVLQRQDLETALRKAIEKQEFILHYQPKVMLSTGAIVGLEALLRWDRPGHGLVSPTLFIPVLEETGLIVSVGRWVIDAACRQIKAWQLGEAGPVQVSVNVAGRQFIEGNLEADVDRALAEHDIPVGLLELEITETSMMVNTDRTMECLRNLRQRGVKVSIDDFGTGYSSLAYLRRFPIDKLKIDIAFIRDVTSNADDAAIVVAIITMAHSLKLVVIAEGVETPAQESYLRRHHCDQIQGYLVSRPLPADAITRLLTQRSSMQPPTVPDESRQTLLIIDDDPFMLEMLATELGGEQFRIVQARTPAQAFALLAQNDIQVILCDQCMPEMEGTTLLDAAKAMYPDTFRIILSGTADVTHMMAAVNRGTIHRFFAKPWNHQVLLDNIRQGFRPARRVAYAPREDEALV